MNPKKFISALAILMIVGINIGCDQVSKSIIRKNINFYDNIELLGKHLILTKVENTGAFLSWGATLPDFAKTLFLLVLPIIVLIVSLVFLLIKSGLSNQRRIGLSFIIGGGIGNLFDRWMYGSVTDFLHVHWGVFQTGIFNLADVSIMIGAFAILSDSFLKRKMVF